MELLFWPQQAARITNTTFSMKRQGKSKSTDLNRRYKMSPFLFTCFYELSTACFHVSQKEEPIFSTKRMEPVFLICPAYKQINRKINFAQSCQNF